MPARSAAVSRSDSPIGVLARFIAWIEATLAAAAARSSGAAGISRSVRHESASLWPNTRSEKPTDAGSTSRTSVPTACFAMSMRRSPPMRCSMLPDASKTTATVAPSSTGFPAAAATTRSVPGAGRGAIVIARLPSVMRWLPVR